MGNRIAFAVIYYGPVPDYLPVFLAGAKRNRHLDFVFFTDWEKLPVEGENIFNCRLPMSEFNRIAVEKGILRRKLTHGYKLCDLKPAWLDILEEYFPEDKYEYAGYIDIDMLLGRMDKYISMDTLAEYDLWTLYDSFIAGPCTLFRNNRMMRRLYRNAECWKSVFDSPSFFAFDEMLQIAADDCTTLESFTDVVAEAERDGIVKVKRNNGISFEDRPVIIHYDRGTIVDGKGREYMCFHYFVSKHSLLWKSPDWQDVPDEFYVNKFGFFRHKNRPVTLGRILISPSHLKQVARKMINRRRDIFKHLKNTNLKKLVELIKNQL